MAKRVSGEGGGRASHPTGRLVAKPAALRRVRGHGAHNHQRNRSLRAAAFGAADTGSSPVGRIARISFRQAILGQRRPVAGGLGATRGATHRGLDPRYMAELLPGAQRHPVDFGDLEDASLAALASHPEKLLDEHWRAQTSYFERLQREHPHELNTGLQRLAYQLAAGKAPTRPGRASIRASTPISCAVPSSVCSENKR
jgi:hypothetical protein